MRHGYVQMPKRTYVYNGFRPYTPADEYCMDSYVDRDFAGNVTEQLIREGAEWNTDLPLPRLLVCDNTNLCITFVPKNYRSLPISERDAIDAEVFKIMLDEVSKNPWATREGD